MTIGPLCSCLLVAYLAADEKDWRLMSRSLTTQLYGSYFRTGPCAQACTPLLRCLWCERARGRGRGASDGRPARVSDGLAASVCLIGWLHVCV